MNKERNHFSTALDADAFALLSRHAEKLNIDKKSIASEAIRFLFLKKKILQQLNFLLLVFGTTLGFLFGYLLTAFGFL